MVGNPASWLFRRMPRVLLIGGLLAVSIYYGIAVQRGAGGHPASPQTDAFSFMQYARAIAEGHPYAYATGDAPSTGSTSHLYPVVLAIPYLLGARGDALLTATFVLNALFYLIWLQIFWRVARRVAPGQAVLAAGLALLNGHILMTVAGLTDMALFTTLAWGLFAALLYERTRLAALLLVFCVFARPEGMLLAVGLAGMGAFLAWRRDPGARRMVGIAACGMAALFAVFALNQALTGFAQFQSVATKGYLKNFSLLGALGCAARDFGTLMRELLFNAGAAPRQAYFLPVAGGLLAVAGMVGISRPAEKAPLVRWWLLGSLAALGLIALSEWQGLSTDRYFLWILPTWYLLAARGAGQAARMCRSPQFFPVLAVLLLGYECAAWPYFAARYGAECVQAQAVANFGKAVDAVLPSQASVGVISGPSIGYELGHRPLRHLAGITTTDFARQRDMLCALEMLKHHPECRFGHLVITASEEAWCDDAGMLGDVLLIDLDAPPDGRIYALCTARWDAFPAAALLPMDPTVSNAVAAFTLVDRLDVGYMPDERRCHYQVGSRLPDQICRPCVASRRIGGRRVTEVGQPVIGWDEFRVQAPHPGQPMRVVMRTTLDATCMVIRATEKFAGEGLHLRSPLQIRPIVNGRTLSAVSLAIATDPDAFSECILDIPAEYITANPVEIVLAGDHIALAYWFYQALRPAVARP
jgi:hypothetical protein